MTLQIYTALAFLMVGLLVDPSHGGIIGDFIAEKAHNKVIDLVSYPNFQIKSAIAYGGTGNHVEFQIVGEKGADLITILIVAKTDKFLGVGDKGGPMTYNENVVGDAAVACTASKNGAVDTNFCDAAFTALKSVNFLKTTAATDYVLKADSVELKTLGTRLREVGKLTVGTGSVEWTIPAVNTLKTNNVAKLLFIGKHTFTVATTKVHGSVLVVLKKEGKKYVVDTTVSFAADGVINTPTDAGIVAAIDKEAIQTALFTLVPLK